MSLDLSYYNLGKQQFLEVTLPGLKRHHFGNLKKLDLSYNNLDNECLEKLVSSLPIPKKTKDKVGLEVLNISGNAITNLLVI